MVRLPRALFVISIVISLAAPQIVSAQVYSGNKRSDAQCGLYAPSSADIQFTCKLVPPQGLAPADVEVSMTNKSGCEVVTRGDIKITGTQGHVYSNNRLGATPGSFYGFDDKYTPYGYMLAPNTQEYPATCELTNIEVCSNTPLTGFSTNTRFNGFQDGKCSRFANITVQFPSVVSPVDMSWSGKSFIKAINCSGCPQSQTVDTITFENGGLHIHEVTTSTIVTSGASSTDTYDAVFPLSNLSGASAPAVGADRGDGGGRIAGVTIFYGAPVSVQCQDVLHIDGDPPINQTRDCSNGSDQSPAEIDFGSLADATNFANFVKSKIGH
jgi:hypothetical protein